MSIRVDDAFLATCDGSASPLERTAEFLEYFARCLDGWRFDDCDLEQTAALTIARGLCTAAAKLVRKALVP